MPAETSSSAGDSEFTRLHISPLDPDLLKIVLPAAVAAQARNISYHNIETFPERRYGYVELPNMEAEKLKRKLNGTVLKGTKLRVEKARPEKRTEPTGALDEEDEKEEKKRSKKSSDTTDGSKKRKRDREVVEGVALTDRKVKRGWTEPADQRRKKSRKDKETEKDGKTTEKKKRQKSKYTDHEECLLKTKVPLNALSNLTEDNLPKKRKKKGNAREITVHEFEKTTKFPTFLKSTPSESSSKPTTEFVEGKGWVDETGNVVEAVKAKPAPGPAVQKPEKSKPVVEEVVEDDDDDTSSSGTSGSDTSSDEESEEESSTSKPAIKIATKKDTEDNTSSSDSSSEEEPDAEAKTSKAVTKKIATKKDSKDDASSSDSSSEESESESESDSEEVVKTKTPQKNQKAASTNVHTTPISSIKADGTRPMSASSTKSLTIKIPPPITPSADKVHPLEALYKRPKAGDNATATPAQQSQPFSFFGGDDIEEDEEEGTSRPAVPMTPFTRQDIEWRNVRSAAPTPDTAHPSRMRNFWTEEDEDTGMEDVAEEDDQQPGSSSQGQSGTSEFQSWFWENRRDLNRSWMNRRKTAAKEKRHRENKARASKTV